MSNVSSRVDLGTVAPSLHESSDTESVYYDAIYNNSTGTFAADDGHGGKR